MTEELSDSEDEEKNCHGIRRKPDAIRRRNQLNYRNLEPESNLVSIWTIARDASSADDTDMEFALDAQMTNHEL
jgi:histone deacetylase 1/2